MTRSLTAMEIAMILIATGQADHRSLEARIRARNLVKIANAIASAGGVTTDSDPDLLHSRLQREVVRRPYLFLGQDWNTLDNLAAIDAMEFIMDGDELIEIRRKTNGKTGTRA